MSTVAASAVGQVDNEAGLSAAQLFEGVVGTSTDGDTITFTLPAKWQGQGFGVVSVSCQKWTTGAPTAQGGRTKAVQPISLVSFVESTGVVSMLLGTGADIGGSETARVYVLIAPTRA